MKPIAIILICALCVSMQSCTSDLVVSEDPEEMVVLRTAGGKVTGDVQVAWNGGGHENTGMEGSGMNRIAVVELEAFEPDVAKDKPSKGFFDLRIYEFGEMAREINANVIATMVNSQTSKAWILAEVTDDSKSCAGGHDAPPEHDGDNGEDHDTGGHDPGCSGDDHDTEGHGGSRCRIGQILAIRLNDTGTPGSDGDMMMWRWFNAADPGLPDIEHTGEWPHLCGKTVISGNLTVH